VRYSPGHNVFDEWVYNAADIDGSRVIWARGMAASDDRELMDYYKDRNVWLVQPDKHPVEISPYAVSGPAPVALGQAVSELSTSGRLSEKARP
jgi:hypothetical protein